MKKFLINNGSDSIILFFTGYGCDEYEFEHLKSKSDILLLYDFSDTDLSLDFDFSKYKEVNLIAFSAGVFIASVFNFNFKLNRKIALSGNPYLFDEPYGLTNDMQDILYNITAETADDFARNYLVKTDEEFRIFHHSRRTIESCKKEFNSLKNLYSVKKTDIKDIFDKAIIGEYDPIFNVQAQKDFYTKRLTIVKNARHNLFFRIKSFEDILDKF